MLRFVALRADLLRLLLRLRLGVAELGLFAALVVLQVRLLLLQVVHLLDELVQLFGELRAGLFALHELLDDIGDIVHELRELLRELLNECDDGRDVRGELGDVGNNGEQFRRFFVQLVLFRGNLSLSKPS